MYRAPVYIHTFQIFQGLVGNFEKDFVQDKNERRVLVKLVLDSQENFLDLNELCNCKRPVNQLSCMCI